MEAKAVARFARISPRKTRAIVKEIKNNKVSVALDKLHFVRKSAAPMIEKVIKSAVANAVKNFGADAEVLYIKELKVENGPILRWARRFMPRAMGRASAIHKRTSHITAVVSDVKNKK
jgi:large subunit ribosomal protein L22